MTAKFQQPSEIIRLSDNWDLWNPAYNEGTRSKSEVVSPESAPSFIRPRWHYLFKQSRSRYPWQFWMEIVAYRIGCIIGVDVPPSHAAIDFDGLSGSLTEWMYDAESLREGMILSGELMLRFDPDYDREKGQKIGHCHSLHLALPIVRFAKGVDEWLRMLTLDTLIANTDRHQDNWGLLWQAEQKLLRKILLWFWKEVLWRKNGRGPFRRQKKPLKIQLTPAFDNGTSLGHERLEERLPEILADQEWFRRHATHTAAQHHIRLQPNDEKGTPMLELVPALLRHFPEKLPVVRQCATFRDKDIQDAVYPLCDFDMPVRLSEPRAEFICRMVCERRDMLMERLDA